MRLNQFSPPLGCIFLIYGITYDQIFKVIYNPVFVSDAIDNPLVEGWSWPLCPQNLTFQNIHYLNPLPFLSGLSPDTLLIELVRNSLQGHTFKTAFPFTSHELDPSDNLLLMG